MADAQHITIRRTTHNRPPTTNPRQRQRRRKSSQSSEGRTSTSRPNEFRHKERPSASAYDVAWNEHAHLAETIEPNKGEVSIVTGTVRRESFGTEGETVDQGPLRRREPDSNRSGGGSLGGQQQGGNFGGQQAQPSGNWGNQQQAQQSSGWGQNPGGQEGRAMARNRHSDQPELPRP